MRSWEPLNLCRSEERGDSRGQRALHKGSRGDGIEEKSACGINSDQESIGYLSGRTVVIIKREKGWRIWYTAAVGPCWRHPFPLRVQTHDDGIV